MTVDGQPQQSTKGLRDAVDKAFWKVACGSANACPPDLVGGALAIQNAIEFAITLAAIALGTAVFDSLGTRVAWLLVPGPILGLIGLAPLLRTRGKH